MAAVEAGRRFVGYDTDATYVALARRRVREAKAALKGCVLAKNSAVLAKTSAQAANGHGQNASAPSHPEGSDPKTSTMKS